MASIFLLGVDIVVKISNQLRNQYQIVRSKIIISWKHIIFTLNNNTFPILVI